MVDIEIEVTQPTTDGWNKCLGKAEDEEPICM